MHLFHTQIAAYADIDHNKYSFFSSNKIDCNLERYEATKASYKMNTQPFIMRNIITTTIAFSWLILLLCSITSVANNDKVGTLAIATQKPIGIGTLFLMRFQ